MLYFTAFHLDVYYISFLGLSMVKDEVVDDSVLIADHTIMDGDRPTIVFSARFIGVH